MQSSLRTVTSTHSSVDSSPIDRSISLITLDLPCSNMAALVKLFEDCAASDGSLRPTSSDCIFVVNSLEARLAVCLSATLLPTAKGWKGTP